MRQNKNENKKLVKMKTKLVETEELMQTVWHTDKKLESEVILVMTSKSSKFDMREDWLTGKNGKWQLKKSNFFGDKQ